MPLRLNVDAGEDLLGDGQSVAAGFAADARLARRSDRFDEIVELQSQRIDGVERLTLLRQVFFRKMCAAVIELFRRQGIDGELSIQERFAWANRRRRASGEVDRHKTLCRPRVHSPNRLIAHSRRR